MSIAILIALLVLIALHGVSIWLAIAEAGSVPVAFSRAARLKRAGGYVKGGGLEVLRERLKAKQR